MGLAEVITAVQSKMANIPGIKSAPVWAKESMPVMPFSICYPRSGHLEPYSGWGYGLHTLCVEIHCNRADIAQDLSLSIPFVDLVFQAFTDDPTILNSVQTVVDLRYTYGRLTWANVETIGYRFELTVKL